MEYDENYELKGLFDTLIHFDSTLQLKAYVEEQLEHFNLMYSNEFKGGVKAIATIIGQLKSVNVYITKVANVIDAQKPIVANDQSQLRNQMTNLAKIWAPYDHPVFHELKSIFIELGANEAHMFWLHVSGSFSSPGNHNQMVATLRAYDFLYERRQLSELSNTELDFVEQNYSVAIEKANQLQVAISSLEERAVEWDVSCQNSWEDWTQKCTDSWEELISQKNSQLERDRSSFEAEHADAIDAANQKITELEVTYQEHLKLEKPAEYWKKSADKYGDSSALWFGVLVVLILAGVAGFAHFYSIYLEGQDAGVKLDTVKGIVLFVSGITVYGFLVRVVSRMLMSATHLKRDSEERAQLTYFYLALIKDGAIDEKSRDIVIQSLFSRTETGLITGDSSPTMPAMDVLKNIKVSS